jgi:hypothetical protein
VTVERFVDAAEILPIYFDNACYVLPGRPLGEDAYAVMAKADLTKVASEISTMYDRRMIDSLPIIRKLQMDAANPSIRVCNLLRVAKIIATKLDLADALVWIDRELDGYLDVSGKDLPKYRLIRCEPKWFNPHLGWQPFHFEQPDVAEIFRRTPLGDALGPIEKGIREEHDGDYVYDAPHLVRATLMDLLPVKTDVQFFIPDSELWAVVDAVRNLVLNWSLQLEKAGIVGENMAFTATEKKEAPTVSHQFFIQNVGILGNVTDQATVKNKQTANLSLDASKVADLIGQARQALSLLPPQARAELAPILDLAEAETKKPSPDTSRLRQLLGSAKTVCEGAVGNLAASGIVGLITKLLGG